MILFSNCLSKEDCFLPNSSPSCCVELAPVTIEGVATHGMAWEGYDALMITRWLACRYIHERRTESVITWIYTKYGKYSLSVSVVWGFDVLWYSNMKRACHSELRLLKQPRKGVWGVRARAREWSIIKPCDRFVPWIRHTWISFSNHETLTHATWLFDERHFTNL